MEFYPNKSDTLDLDTLKAGMVGISSATGAYYAEAASVCLEQQDHQPGVQMQVNGTCEHRIGVTWTRSDNLDRLGRSWNDKPDTTEKGAYGIAALLVDRLTEYTVVGRSWKGTGFDFWLDKKGASTLLLQGTARMEVSGIRQGSDRNLTSRTRQKSEQMKPTDGTGLPGIAVVVEFGAPRTRVNAR